MSKKFVRPKNLPQKAWEIWEKVYNSNKKKVGEARAAKIAWAAVKKGWKKKGDKWIRKTASEIKLPDTFRGSTTDLGLLDVDDYRSKIEIMRVGKWDHPLYGEFEITPERLSRFVINFENGVRKAIAIDVEHKSDEGAVGWINNLTVDDNDNPQVLFAEVEWTTEGLSLIRGKKYRFFSPEFADEYEDAASGKEYKDVLIGGAITNRPFFQELEEIVLSEKIDKSKKMINGKKGGERKMALKREELKAKLLEDPEFVPADEDEVDEDVLAEVKKEIATEAKKDEEDEGSDEGKADEPDEEGKDEAEDEKSEASDKTKGKKLSEGQIAINAKRFKELELKAQMGVKAHKELEAMKMSETLGGYTYSETNPKGKILPKDINLVKEFALTLGKNQLKKFFEILDVLPQGNVFGEIGSSEVSSEPFEDKNAELDRRAKKLMSENPKKYKEYRDALYAAEKQMSEEGIEFRGSEKGLK